ncbi:MAG: tRNA glutamyl-Q(34) synthetase GluQRS [Chromatiaceae bacterium]|nr:tRNA glutamyl-Q(34) synthetase GluQRS [Chromatiaceae bacterium]MCP5437828.1 tRNA glutamyl-Q(34) synthetase GluQRS [Chromatiaceae bacterium]MCP5439501.1 tRNA glutamyl-Q(34) synthetase GluQRS [Chromatiaceae bacterium]HPE80203.1 tRNA glutamyl-Q(34) synthetase GluQRS [Gammaproteobacteria bacterium]
MPSPVYRGRFAPSPTGPLHFGSLVAAVASHADARHQNGEWLIRIEDVDETRTRTGSEQSILSDLRAFGMSPDQEPVRQSERAHLYQEALDRLVGLGAAYPCSCSRRAIAAIARPGCEGFVYPRTCRGSPPPPDVMAAWRFTVGDEVIRFRDRIVGETGHNLDDEVGDFVIRRIDGYFAYQLAVVVDDQAQGITDIVRGADLLWSTPRQIALQRRLGYRMPRYAHIPLVIGKDGHKLSKRDLAHPVDSADPVQGLVAAWRHLGQQDPPASIDSCEAFWSWAGPHWHIDRIPHDRNSRHEHTESL